MSHMCSRASSGKENFSVFCKQLKRTGKTAVPVSTASVECKCMNYNKGHGRHKMKRLRTRKERSQIRSAKEPSTGSHHHHCHCHISEDISLFQSPCHTRCSTIDAPDLSVALIAQEPSIITDNRLIGHHGLFNKEVKSIDIERLLSEQRKLEKSGEKIQEKDNSDVLSNSDNDEAVSFQMKAELSAKAPDNCQEKEKINPGSCSQPSHVKPGQRPAQTIELLSNSENNTDSLKHGFSDEVIVKNKKTELFIQVRESPQTPTGYNKTVKKKVKGQMNPTLDHTPNNQETPVYPKQINRPSPSSLLHSSSTTAGTSGSFNIHHPNQDSDTISKSVSAVAATLCQSIWFPHLGQRSLVAESRNVLLKALQKKHGPQLQKNLLEVQRCLHFDTYPGPRQVQDQQLVITDNGGSWCTDAFTAALQAESSRQPCFGAEKMAVFKTIESQQYNCESNQWPNKNSEEAADAEWTTSSVEKSGSLLDDIFNRRSSPYFCMDFKTSEGLSGESQHLFAPSHTEHYEDKVSVSQQLDNHFIRPRKELGRFESFGNSFMNLHDTTTLRERRRRCHHSDSIQPFIPYHVHLPHRRSAEPMPFLQEHGLFEATDRFPFGFSFSNRISHPQQGSLLQSFSQFNPSSAYSTLRMHQNDLTHYPPSHMLDTDSTSSIHSFPSPEHWSFPPMRLY